MQFSRFNTTEFGEGQKFSRRKFGLKPWQKGIIGLLAAKKGGVKFRKSVDLAMKAYDVKRVYFNRHLVKTSQFLSDMSMSQV